MRNLGRLRTDCRDLRFTEKMTPIATQDPLEIIDRQMNISRQIPAIRQLSSQLFWIVTLRDRKP